jgi:hypothetical protein
MQATGTGPVILATNPVLEFRTDTYTSSPGWGAVYPSLLTKLKVIDVFEYFVTVRPMRF